MVGRQVTRIEQREETFNRRRVSSDGHLKKKKKNVDQFAAALLSIMVWLILTELSGLNRLIIRLITLVNISLFQK